MDAEPLPAAAGMVEIGAGPPLEVLEAIDAAAEVLDRLAARGIHLHLVRGPGGLRIELHAPGYVRARELTLGAILRLLPEPAAVEGDDGR